MVPGNREGTHTKQNLKIKICKQHNPLETYMKTKKRKPKHTEKNMDNTNKKSQLEITPKLCLEEKISVIAFLKRT